MDFVPYSDCVGWPDELVDVAGGLIDMISDAEEVTARQFVNKVGKAQSEMLAHNLGYTGPTKGYSNPRHPGHQPGCMSMEEDPIGVRFCKSRVFGREVWYARQSGIEHVFVPKGWTPSLSDANSYAANSGSSSSSSGAKCEFFSRCVEWPEDLVNVPGGLCDLVDTNYSESITLHTFMKNVCPVDLLTQAHELHYTGVKKAHNNPKHPVHNPRAKVNFSLEEDHHVRYERGQLLGREVYFLVHSAIEYVFIPPNWKPSIKDVDWDFDPDADPEHDDAPAFGR